MEIEGRIIFDLGIQSGTSKAGNPWKKREMVLETFGTYPRKVKFTIFGDQRVDNMRLEVGRDYTISVDIESREFNGRWYTDVNAFQARDYAGTPAAAPAPAPAYQAPAQAAPSAAPQGFGAPAAPSFTAPAGGDEDLPF